LKRDQDDFYDTTGSSFFIIKQGTATCIQADPHGNQQEVAQLTTGDYFGENALLASKPRQGTVKATGKNGTLKLLYVERTTFNRILGSIEDILRRNQSY
jgi:cAMP-dependent protein kinase regulator